MGGSRRWRLALSPWPPRRPDRSRSVAGRVAQRPRRPQRPDRSRMTSPPQRNAAAETLTRDFTVAVFVVAAGRVLLHWHRKLGMWLPPGGHIEPNELPDEAAVRETLEETGVAIRLVGGRGLDRDFPDEPRQLVRPAGIQLEDIGPGHQHIDLVY